MDSCIKHVLIVGGGTAGWMTAAALSHALQKTRVKITLVESAEIGTVGVGEATVPHIRFFNQTLGFDEAEFMRRTQATYKLGIEFRNWSRIGDSYIHPFGTFGHDFGGVAFHQHWLRLRQEGHDFPLESFSLPVVAARENKFAFPSQDTARLEGSFSYAFQFDAGLYASFLRSYAEERGVVRKEGKILAANQSAETGFLSSVVLDGGATIEADLFVDCSGFRGLLIEEKLAAGYEEWTHWLPCDRAIAVPCLTKEAPAPYTRSTALSAGWTWRIPLQHRVGNGHVYSSAFLSDDEAERQLLERLEAPPLAEPRKLRFKTGKRRKQWDRNVVAIGLAAGFLEPLESTSIHLTQLGITKLIELFPQGAWEQADEREFNRSMAVEYERVRDFLILHYCATERDDSPFWNHCRTMELPESLASKMDLFKERGIVAKYTEGMFLEPSWLAVYLGQNIVPASYNPISNQLPSDELVKRFNHLQGQVARLADGMPSHGQVLARITSKAAAA